MTVCSDSKCIITIISSSLSCVDGDVRLQRSRDSGIALIPDEVVECGADAVVPSVVPSPAPDLVCWVVLYT